MSEILSDPFYRTIIVGIGVIIASVVVGKILKILLDKIFRAIFHRTKTTLDDRILGVFRSKVIPLTLLAGFGIGLREIRKVIKPEYITWNHVLDYITILLYIGIVFVITRMVAQIIQETIGWYMDEVSQKTETNVRSTIAPLMTKIINIVLFVMAVMIVLDHFGINVGSFLVSLGVASLAVALAAQDTLANMIAGFVILVDRPFRVGDRIQLSTGEIGDIYEIGLRSTRILNLENNILVLPNAELIKNRILNFSFPQPHIRVIVDIGVAYGTDIEQAKYIISNVVKSHPDILKDQIPSIFLVQFGESSLVLRLIATTSDYRLKFKIESDLREQIYREFQIQNIQIPLPQRVVYLKTNETTEA